MQRCATCAALHCTNSILQGVHTHTSNFTVIHSVLTAALLALGATLSAAQGQGEGEVVLLPAPVLLRTLIVAYMLLACLGLLSIEKIHPQVHRTWMSMHSVCTAVKWDCMYVDSYEESHTVST